MPVTFKYNNKQYTTNNLDFKLAKLNITKNDITIMGDQSLVITDIKDCFAYYNHKDKIAILSSYDSLDSIVENPKRFSRGFNRDIQYFVEHFIKNPNYFKCDSHIVISESLDGIKNKHLYERTTL